VTSVDPIATGPYGVPLPARPPRTVCIVLPAYNEADHLPALLHALRETMEDNRIGYEIIVVDDGSHDHTAAIVKEWGADLPLVLVRHAANEGLGATLRDGLQTALERSGTRDIVITMDADDTP
jgi:dolichol-phosphate mannosyltransferase